MSCCCLGNRARVYGSHSAGREAGDPGGGPLSAGTCHHVQAGSKVREREREGGEGGRGGRRKGIRRKGREEGAKGMKKKLGDRGQVEL